MYLYEPLWNMENHGSMITQLNLLNKLQFTIRFFLLTKIADALINKLFIHPVK